MILFISHYGGRTGAPFVLLHLLKWLRANTKLDLRVIVRGDGPLVESFRAVAETVVIKSPATRFGRLMYRLPGMKNQGSLPDAWKHLPIDLIYSNTITNGVLVSKLARPGVPVITHVHEMSYWIERSGADNLKRVMEHTTRFIAVSQAVKDNLTENLKVPSNLIDVVHAFISDSTSATDRGGFVRKKFRIPDNAFIVGGSGQESWRKGRDLFVQLAANVRRLLPSVEVHFLWVGSTGDTEEQQRLNYDATQAGVYDRVHWTGEVNDPERYFSELDLFAMVSREDPFPLVCLENASLSKPILCFAGAGGIPELVDVDAGFVVPYLDLHAMACRIVELVENPLLIAKLGARAKAKVLERHTIGQAGPMVLKVIEGELKRAKQS